VTDVTGGDATRSGVAAFTRDPSTPTLPFAVVAAGATTPSDDGAAPLVAVVVVAAAAVVVGTTLGPGRTIDTGRDGTPIVA